MRIAVDEAIPYWNEAFIRFGEVRPFSGRKLRPADIRDVDALIVRSVTKVDSSLLEGSAVRFVGSATIGMDHLDVGYLKSRDIHYCNASGCNANAVSEYIVAALVLVAKRKGWDLKSKSIGVIGVGNVGSRVEKKAHALGMSILLCDPPLRDASGDQRYASSLDDVLGADILTFHVPLTTDGPYPTYHMVDKDVLERLSSRQFVINSSRGPVIKASDLKEALAARKIEGAVLDVWEDEPKVDLSLLDLVEIGTPHIAGYSIDGKIRATEMIFEELCRHFRQPLEWEKNHLYPAIASIEPRAERLRDDDALRSIISQAYDILRDDSAMRNLGFIPPDGAQAGFDRLRNEYRFRPEFRHFSITLNREQNRLAGVLRSLGFQIEGGGAV